MRYEVRMRLPKAFKALSRCWDEWFRYFVYYGGRGGGKSENVCRILLVLGMQDKLRILCCRELQRSINDSIYKLLAEIIDSEGLGSFYTVMGEKIVGVNGTEFIFAGLKSNVSALKSMAHIDICYVEEAENISSKSWEALIPTIRKQDVAGGRKSFFVIVFNPRYASDATYKRFVVGADSSVYLKKVSWRDNPFFPEVLEMERTRLEKNDPAAYKHIWEGEFDERYSGAIYANWVAKASADGRFKQGLYDESLPVNTAWDLGYDDTTAVWFWQKAGTEIRLVDYYENSMQDIKHYCDVLVEKGYRYGSHYVPHDAANKLLAAGGRSIIQQAYQLGVKMLVVPATSQQNQIEAARKILEQSWFDPVTCKEGIDALMEYKFEYDADKDVFKSKPRHDWSSHASDGYEIIGQVFRNQLLSDPKEVKPIRTLSTMTAEELFWGEDNADYRIEKI